MEAFVVGYQSTEDGVEHKFVAFRDGNQWGYVSPMSYGELDFGSLEAVCVAWDYDNVGSTFYLETWHKETEQFSAWGII
jgi:hypothetical protein